MSQDLRLTLNVLLHAAVVSTVVTDLHQHFGSLEAALGRSLNSTLQALKDNPKMVLVFLGDYGDRGSFEVFMPLLELKLMFPDQVWLLRGNHEVRPSSNTPMSNIALDMHQGCRGYGCL